MGRYLFSQREDVERLVVLARNSRRLDIDNKIIHRPADLATGWLFLTPDGGIPAATATDPGMAECTPLALVPNNPGSPPKFEVVTENDGSPMTVAVYNVFSSPIAEDVKVTAKRITGYIVADAEDCGTGGGDASAAPGASYGVTL